ncbi:hypothetical protein GQR42_23525 [Microcystis aeruginosa FD4]|uniref:Uncharacterized protein n=1 Tax=Microcystis aeruginosa FD4 TaxID=2686288 RepID=A0A857D7X7_MICAE|nr:hypothetical protein [Microcystis aeruginosa]QGZ92038.1 hypothetical protein GQR42_23525 [Microcystis aeruginosa FD4]
MVLEDKSEEWLQYPEDYQTLGRDLAALGKVMTGNLGEVCQRISLQLRDAVRDVSSVEGENLGSTGDGFNGSGSGCRILV